MPSGWRTARPDSSNIEPMLSPSDQDRLADACRFAFAHHAAQVRKGTHIPYVSHLLQVSGLVLEHGGDIDQAAAAILHDTLEDCPEVTVSELQSQFGPRVTRMVIDCSDTIASENGAPGSSKPTWQERKDAYLAHLATADQESVLVAFCDKVHNLGTITDDLLEDGPASLDRFTASPERQVWYFRRVLEMAGPRVPTKLRRRLDTLLSTFRAAVSEP